MKFLRVVKQILPFSANKMSNPPLEKSSSIYTHYPEMAQAALEGQVYNKSLYLDNTVAKHLQTFSRVYIIHVSAT